jgi:DNA gyrase subunit A
MTALQSSFGVNFVAIVNQRPVTLSLMEALRHFLDFRQDVVTKRTLYRLKKARERFHILEGLKRAIDLMDQIIALIRASDSPETAREGLMSSYAFSEIQARAILDMRLQRLTALERDKIEAEYEEVRKIILELERILGSRDVLMGVVREEFVELREKFGDDRRTRIVPDEGEIDFESLIPDDPC